VLQIFGGIVLAVYMIWDRMKDLKREVVISGLQKKVLELEKNSEIEILKKNAESKQTIKIIEQKP
jgi:Zn-finger domain-containing protein